MDPFAGIDPGRDTLVAGVGRDVGVMGVDVRGRRSGASEVAIAVVAAFTYVALAAGLFGAYFPLDESKAGGPGEFVSGVSIQWFVAHTIATQGELPLWNPFIRTGIPYIGNPYITILNPLVLAPLWYFGPTDGAKVAVVLACAMAGIGQYWLGRMVGLGRLASFASGAIGLSAGSFVIPIATGFSFAGPMQHALIGAVLASFIAYLRRPTMPRLVLASATSAIMFFTGFLYYWIGIGIVLLIFAIGHVSLQASRASSDPKTMVGKLAIPIISYGMLVLGFISPSLLPLIELMPYIEKPMDVTNSGTLPFLVTLFGFVVSEKQFWANGLFGASPLGWAIYYSYIGATVLVGIPASVAAIIRGHLRYASSLIVSFIVIVILASIHKTVFAPLLDIFSFLKLFRFWGSLVAVATVVALPLLLAGADWLWSVVVSGSVSRDLGLPEWELRLVTRDGPDLTGRRFDLGRIVGGVGVIWFLGAAIADPWSTNRRIVTTPQWNLAEDEVFRWARSQGVGPMIVNANSMIYALASSSQQKYELQVLDSAFPMKLRPSRVSNRDALWSAPRFALTLPNAPANPRMQLIKKFQGGWIYALPPGLPFAFVAPRDAIPYGPEDVGARAVQAGTVVEAPARFDGPNRLVVTVPRDLPWASPVGSATPRLVVMQAWMPGWRASGSSGERRSVVAVSEYLGVSDARPGETVTLEYLPTSYFVGKVIGFLAIAISLFGVVLPGSMAADAWARILSRVRFPRIP